MTDVDEQGRPEPPLHGDELQALLGFLEFQRATLQWKAGGLDADGMRTTTAASTMTLAGIVKHLAWVEDYWFTYRLAGSPPSEPWRSVDWDATPDWEWTSAAADDPVELLALWHDNVARSRVAVDQAMADGGLDRLAAEPWASGEAPNLRWILLHMIEEYARHNGHADLLREVVDGDTGE